MIRLTMLLLALTTSLLLSVGCDGGGDDDATGDDDDSASGDVGYEIGDTVPPCWLTNQDGDGTSVHDAAGDRILLVISAGWCAPCADAADEAQALYDELSGEFAFTLFETLIQDDTYSNDVSTDELQAWKDDHGLTTLDVWTDGPEECLDPFGDVELPTFVIIDEELVIRDEITNFNSSIEGQIKDALRAL